VFIEVANTRLQNFPNVEVRHLWTTAARC